MNPLRTTILILGIFLSSMLFIPVYSNAETDGINIGIKDTDIIIDTIPENPEPYQDITIKISSYSTDLNKALIQWRNGSTILLSGYGKTTYSFKALGPNTTTTFTVVITSDLGDRITKRISISPSEVELLWEAVDGYTPPFYRGKAFVSSEGAIRVVAIPNTTTIKSGRGSISYVWKRNDNTIASASGYNKDAYVFTNSELNDSEDISVVASAVDNRYNATKSIEIPIIAPKVLFYRKSPTEGILYNRALTDETFISEDEMTLVALPYYLAIAGNESDFSYKWKINGETIDTPSRKNELTIRPTSRDGYATINIVFENLNTFFQKVTGQLKINL